MKTNLSSETIGDDDKILKVRLRHLIEGRYLDQKIPQMIKPNKKHARVINDSYSTANRSQSIIKRRRKEANNSNKRERRNSPLSAVNKSPSGNSPTPRHNQIKNRRRIIREESLTKTLSRYPKAEQLIFKDTSDYEGSQEKTFPIQRTPVKVKKPLISYLSTQKSQTPSRIKLLDEFRIEKIEVLCDIPKMVKMMRLNFECVQLSRKEPSKNWINFLKESDSNPLTSKSLFPEPSLRTYTPILCLNQEAPCPGVRPLRNFFAKDALIDIIVYPSSYNSSPSNSLKNLQGYNQSPPNFLTTSESPRTPKTLYEVTEELDSCELESMAGYQPAEPAILHESLNVGEIHLIQTRHQNIGRVISLPCRAGQGRFTRSNKIEVGRIRAIERELDNNLPDMTLEWLEQSSISVSEDKESFSDVIAINREIYESW